MLWIIIGILVMLTLSAMFSGMEIAFVSADKLNVEILRHNNTRRGRIVVRFFDNPNEFLSTMLVGNNIALVVFSLLLGVLLEPTVEPFFRETMPAWMPDRFVALLPMTLLTTLIVLIFGEFLPKLMFRLYADRILYTMAFPTLFFKKLLTPISWLMVGLSEQFLKLFFKKSDKEAEGVFTRKDLAKFITSTSPEGGADNTVLNTKMFSNVLDMKQTRVRKCIIPRNEVKAVEVNDSVADLREMFVETKKSKIIVYNDSIEHIMGYVHHQSMLSEPKDIRSVMRNITIVPEAMPIQDLMEIFIRERSSIAYVVDEFGRTSGIITFEDILEEIFGEIEDEHDHHEEDLLEEKVSDREFRFSGRLEIDHLNESYEQLDIEKGEYVTLSGYIVMTQGRIPKKDEVIEMGNCRFLIEEMAKTKIEVVRVEVVEEEE